MFNNGLINTTLFCFLGRKICYHKLAKNLLSHIFSEFVRTNLKIFWKMLSQIEVVIRYNDFFSSKFVILEQT